nr:AMP-binding protein [Nonomuraea longispora]
MSYFCTFSEAAAYVCPDDEHRACAPDTPPLVLGELPGRDPVELPDPDTGDVAFLQLSGDSTGLPKLIPRTHDDYIYSFRASAEICALGPGGVYLCALPAAHNFPMSSPGVLGALPISWRSRRSPPGPNCWDDRHDGDSVAPGTRFPASSGRVGGTRARGARATASGRCVGPSLIPSSLRP